MRLDGLVVALCLFLEKAFEAVLGFDENIFLYCEEMILSERMRNKGYMTYFYPEWTIYHYHRGAHNPESEKIGRVSKKYYYRKYRGASTISLKISDMSYFLCKKIYRLKKILDGTYFREKKH